LQASGQCPQNINLQNWGFRSWKGTRGFAADGGGGSGFLYRDKKGGVAREGGGETGRTVRLVFSPTPGARPATAPKIVKVVRGLAWETPVSHRLDARAAHGGRGPIEGQTFHFRRGLGTKQELLARVRAGIDRAGAWAGARSGRTGFGWGGTGRTTGHGVLLAGPRGGGNRRERSIVGPHAGRRVYSGNTGKKTREGHGRKETAGEKRVKQNPPLKGGERGNWPTKKTRKWVSRPYRGCLGDGERRFVVGGKQLPG